MAGKTVRSRLRAALFAARAAITFALVDVAAIAAATVALLPLALRGRPAGTRWHAPEPARPTDEAEVAEDAGESPAGSP